MNRGYPQHIWEYDVPTASVRLYVIEDEQMARSTTAIEPRIIIPRNDYEDLKEWMKDNDPFGQFVTDRKEDLKIIHRLIDVHQKLVER